MCFSAGKLQKQQHKDARNSLNKDQSLLSVEMVHACTKLDVNIVQLDNVTDRQNHKQRAHPTTSYAGDVGIKATITIG